MSACQIRSKLGGHRPACRLCSKGFDPAMDSLLCDELLQHTTVPSTRSTPESPHAEHRDRTGGTPCGSCTPGPQESRASRPVKALYYENTVTFKAATTRNW